MDSAVGLAFAFVAAMAVVGAFALAWRYLPAAKELDELRLQAADLIIRLTKLEARVTTVDTRTRTPGRG